MSPYQTTTVASSKSQEDIRRILQAHGVRGVQFAEDFQTRNISVRFVKEVDGNLRTVSVSMTVPEPPPTQRKRAVRFSRGRMVYNKTQAEKQEQMARATYRALHYWLKSQFEAVDFGLLSFEDIFLSHFEWMIDGRMSTIGKVLQPYLARPQLKAPSPSDVLDGEIQEYPCRSPRYALRFFARNCVTGR